MKKILIFLSIFAGIFFFNPLFATQQQDTVTDNRPVLKEDASPQTAVILPDKRAEKDFSLNALFRGMLGMASLILLWFLLSSDKKNIPWKTVATGLFIQVLLAVGVLYVPFIRYSFEFMGQIFVKILDFTKSGSEFLLGDLMDSKTYGFIFLFQVLPTIIFFSALTSLLFYWGIIL